MLPLLLLCGCGAVDWASLFSSDIGIDASCAGTDTVLVDGRDLCEEYERTGTLDCTVGYRIVLDGEQVCPK
jgi:hypothetical protein